MHKDATRQARTTTVTGVAARSKRWLTLGAMISFLCDRLEGDSWLVGVVLSESGTGMRRRESDRG